MAKRLTAPGEWQLMWKRGAEARRVERETLDFSEGAMMEVESLDAGQ